MSKEVPYKIRLSEEAFKEHLEFSKWVEVELRQDGKFVNMTDWAGKLPGAAARIAGLFHCAENPDQPWEKEVSQETMEKALELASIFSIHAHKVFNSSESDSTIKQAMRILKWIEDKNLSMFSQKECFDKFKGTFQKVKDLEPILDLLLEHHYIKNCASIEKKPGRPSKTFDVNPMIMKGQS